MMQSLHHHKESGFTLIELMVAMTVASLLAVAIYSVYTAQVVGQISQDVSLDMQQGGRAAFEIMEKEIQMAGCDPTQEADAEITIARAGELRFTMDVTRDPATWSAAEGHGPDGLVDGPNENIRYGLTLAKDPDRDGVANSTPCDLCRETANGGLQSFAKNIEELRFTYFEVDEDGALLQIPYAEVDEDSEQDRRDDIRAINVNLVARTGDFRRGMMRQPDRELVFNRTIYCRNIR